MQASRNAGEVRAFTGALCALGGAYFAGTMLWFWTLWSTPPVGVTGLPGWMILHGAGMPVVMLCFVLFVGPRLPWRMRFTVAMTMAMPLAPGGLLALNSNVERYAAEEHSVEVVGFTEVDAGAKGTSAWFLQVRDEQGEPWSVVVGERWTVDLPAGSKGTLRVHHGLLGLRWTTLHDVLVP